MARKNKPANEVDTDFEEKAEADTNEITQEGRESEESVETSSADDLTEDAEADPDAEDAEPSEEAAATAAPAPEEPVNLPPAVTPDPVVIRKGGFVPMVLGGLVAGAIGFGVAHYVLPGTGADPEAFAALQRAQADQADVDSQLAERVEQLETGADLDDLKAGQSDNLSAISALADRLSDLETRLGEIETRPAGEGPSGAAIAAYERELSDLKAAVGAMQDNAKLLEENAQAAAQATLQRAALTRIMTALDTGAGFDSALTDLESLGVDVPETLRQASGGIPSLTDLQEEFPDLARAALSASREATRDADGGGFSSFLRNQLGARSLAPREGNDPDAVLSRAEAAAREGRLTDALAELEALPDEGRAALAGWASHVSQRLEAVAAAQELGDQLN